MRQNERTNTGKNIDKMGETHNSAQRKDKRKEEKYANNSGKGKQP